MSSAELTPTQDVFGSARRPGTMLHHVAELLDAQQLCVLETPQVYDSAGLHAALSAHPSQPSPAAAALAANVPMLLLPTSSHNFAVRDYDGLHLLRRLLGEPKKAGKDRYGGLGW